MSPRWARGKADANHHELIDELRSAGWDVIPTYALRGFVDAVAYRSGCGVRLIEFKTPKGALTAAQHELLARGWPIVVVRTAEDVHALV
jgi:hypothetical protein